MADEVREMDDIRSDQENQQDDEEADQLNQLCIATKNEGDRKKKRKSITMAENEEKEWKHALTSLTRPSYNLGQRSKSLRAWCRPILRNMVANLMSEHNWAEASQALSVYLHATRNKRSVEDNEFKFTALLDILAHLGEDSVDRVKSVYDIWIRKNGPMKDQPVEIRFSVHVKFINWCLEKGNLDDAYQTALWLIQENDFGKDQNSTIVVARTFYELWYSNIPKELLRTESNWVSSPSRRYDTDRLPDSKWCDGSNYTIASAGLKYVSDSVQNYEALATNSGIKVKSIQSTEIVLKKDQPRGFYINSNENTGNETSLSNHADKFPIASLSVLEGLDPSLFPLQLPQSGENYGNLFDMHLALLNDNYKEALKYSKLALFSSAYDKEVLHTYIQLLLVGGQIDEALKELDKICKDSNATAESMRIRDSLLKHFDRHNIVNLNNHFEDILKKDPTCCHAMEKLVAMHQNGDYKTELLFEMIGLHLDGTQNDHGTQASDTTWKEFASCFMKLSEFEEDQMSMCFVRSENGLKQKTSVSFDKIPKLFRNGKLREKWRHRWESWMTGHFSCERLAKDISAGDSQLLAYKAACGSHIYGPQSRYALEVQSSLEKKNETDLILFLKLNNGKSLQLYSRLFMDNI